MLPHLGTLPRRGEAIALRGASPAFAALRVPFASLRGGTVEATLRLNQYLSVVTGS